MVNYALRRGWKYSLRMIHPPRREGLEQKLRQPVAGASSNLLPLAGAQFRKGIPLARCA